MASSPDDQTSAKQTLNPSINGNDAPCPPQEHVGDEELKPSVPQSTDVIESGEKRKRSDPADSDNCRHPLWKTSLCSYFRSHSGSCSHGDACRYAHGEEELRQRPDNTWDPTSERAKKLLKSESGEKCDSKEDDVMMTEAVVDDDCADPGLSKCLLHLPLKWHSDQLRDFLGQQASGGVIYKSAKKKKGMMIGFVTFESAEQLKNAMEELEGKSIGNKNLKVGDVLPRSFEKKNNSALPLHQSTQKNMETALGGDDTDVSMSSFGLEDGDAVCDSSAPDSVLKARSARDVATPLAHLTYTDQLEHKKNSLMQTLKKLTRNARKACPNGVSLPEWILKSREIGGVHTSCGLPCKFEGILESPLVNGYRNKCEFSVGYSLQGKATVGFMLGNFREGITAVEEPADCPNVSMIARRYATIFQEFLQHSGLPLWNRFNNTGFWRQLTVREGRKPGKAAEAKISEPSISEVLVMVQVCSKGIDDEILNGEFERLAQAFTMGATANSPLPLTALVVQSVNSCSSFSFGASTRERAREGEREGDGECDGGEEEERSASRIRRKESSFTVESKAFEIVVEDRRGKIQGCIVEKKGGGEKETRWGREWKEQGRVYSMTRGTNRAGGFIRLGVSDIEGKGFCIFVPRGRRDKRGWTTMAEKLNQVLGFFGKNPENQKGKAVEKVAMGRSYATMVKKPLSGNSNVVAVKVKKEESEGLLRKLKHCVVASWRDGSGGEDDIEKLGQFWAKSWDLKGNLGLAKLNKRKALLEFENLEEARRVVSSGSCALEGTQVRLEHWSPRSGCWAEGEERKEVWVRIVGLPISL
ncbi:Zinc finger CCCH domain-containing protein 24 [Vitis vinifera]|uniref:Zinc finger CCCH domain-containing protein 24 n=1 Tax=Vitis vinifera TaxID=29760 RepID=A0A438DTF4_VITVI|nr:Zinc finger CCCH domain-containing protein 24 [Vitis vinifera]